jgi:hypothetical protein
MNPERAGQFGDQEVILVGGADLPGIGEAETPDVDGEGAIDRRKRIQRLSRRIGERLAHGVSFLARTRK